MTSCFDVTMNPARRMYDDPMAALQSARAVELDRIRRERDGVDSATDCTDDI
jgi:hypothetical protein